MISHKWRNKTPIPKVFFLWGIKTIDYENESIFRFASGFWYLRIRKLVTLIPFSPPYIFVQRVFNFRKKDTIISDWSILLMKWHALSNLISNHLTCTWSQHLTNWVPNHYGIRIHCLTAIKVHVCIYLRQLSVSLLTYWQVNDQYLPTCCPTADCNSNGQSTLTIRIFIPKLTGLVRSLQDSKHLCPFRWSNVKLGGNL